MLCSGVQRYEATAEQHRKPIFAAAKLITVKSFQTILNAVLIIAVIFLFVKVYSKPGEETAVVPVKGQAAVSKIVFVNSDSLLDQYNLFKTMKDQLEHKRDSIDGVLTRRGNALQAEVQTYQQEAGRMTDEQRQQREEVLMRKQQSLVAERDAILEKLGKDEEALNDTIHNDLVGYLKTFNKNNRYDFILGYQRGGGILLANDSLDVTKQVVSGLNKK